MSQERPQSEPEPSAPADSTAVRQVLGLFVVPLLVVLACVGVFVGFGWIAYDQSSVGDYLRDLRDTRQIFAHRRKQAAYELSKILSANPEALVEEPGARSEVRQLFATSDDLWVRRYLALVLGHTGDQDAVTMLIEATHDEDSQTRIYAIWALGAIGEAVALGPLLEVLSDPDPGIRKTAAFALGELGEAKAVAALEGRLGDRVTDVRWNAALALAQLGSDAGLEVLAQMLDRKLLAQVPDITPKQEEEAMIGAVRALARLQATEPRAALERLALEDPSLKVRQAAIEARSTWAGEN